MKTLQFNFNHENETTPINLFEDGHVEIAVDNETIEFESATAFAEFFAMARSVLPEHLKNWELLIEGDSAVYKLKSSTAGNGTAVSNVIAALNEHGADPSATISIVSLINSSDDPIGALTTFGDQALALIAIQAFSSSQVAPTAVSVEDVEEEVIEEPPFIDELIENESPYLLCRAFGIDGDSTKEELRVHVGDASNDAVREIWYTFRRAAREDHGYLSDELLEIVLRQSTDHVVADVDSLRNRIATIRLAGRSGMHVKVIRVGRRHIKEDTVYKTLDELTQLEGVSLTDNVLKQYVFDATVDAEIERERAAEILEAARNLEDDGVDNEDNWD